MFTPEKNFLDWNLKGFNNAPVLLFENVESTHALTKEKAYRKEISSGMFIIADSQNSGRGRHSRTWKSPAGKNLFFNLFYDLDGFSPSAYSQMTQVAAITLAEIFQSLGANVQVKWPNDILFEKKKLCGILAEILRLQNKTFLSMGIGINVNSTALDYSELNRPIITLKDILKQNINREILMQKIITSFEIAFLKFKQLGLTPWITAWKKMDAFLGEEVSLISSKNATDETLLHPKESEKERGKIIDINPDGSLLFQNIQGEMRTIYSADIEV